MVKIETYSSGRLAVGNYSCVGKLVELGREKRWPTVLMHAILPLSTVARDLLSPVSRAEVTPRSMGSFLFLSDDNHHCCVSALIFAVACDTIRVPISRSPPTHSDLISAPSASFHITFSSQRRILPLTASTARGHCILSHQAMPSVAEPSVLTIRLAAKALRTFPTLA